MDGLSSEFVRDMETLYQNSSEANCSCDMEPQVTLLYQDLPICNIALLPAWILAVVIGLTGGMTISKLGPRVIGSRSYSTTFFMYAAMITSGFIVHCLFLVECGAGPVTEVEWAPKYPNTLLSSSLQEFVFVAKIDLSLTVCIAISFIFNGLVDLRLLPEDEFCSLLLMWTTYVTVFILEFGEYVNGWTLYTGSIAIGCPTYLLCQLVVLYRSKHGINSLIYLTAAGIVGGVSFILYAKFLCQLCLELGAWSVQGVWYYGSDITMFFLLKYTLSTRSPARLNLNTPSEKPTLPVTKHAKMGYYCSIPNHTISTDKTLLPKPV